MKHTTYQRVKENLAYLKLKQMVIALDQLLAHPTTNQHYLDVLLQLTDHEVAVKRENVRNSMVKVANFPNFKGIDQFDFSFQPSINEQTIRTLATLQFIEQTQNIIFIGNSGVGKTHLAVGLGIEAALNRYSTYFIKCHTLLMQLKQAQLENQLQKKLKHFTKYKVLIIDEFGYLPLQPGEAKLLFQVIDARYEKKSTIVTTNIPFDKWDTILQDVFVTNAILDRLLHHSHVLHIPGDSYRLKDVVFDS